MKFITEILQKRQIHYIFLKNIDIFGKKDKIIISENIIIGKKGRLIMKKQDGKTSLEILLTIVILLIVAGVAFAMIFGGTDIGENIKGLMQKNDTNVTNTVQEQQEEIIS